MIQWVGSMDKKIILKKNALSVEMALLIDDELIHYYVDSVLEDNLQNRIVIGQVKQVVKNLNAVFVDYGEEKNGMLHLKQVPLCYQNKIQQGFSLPVQIVKQNIGEKGHKLTAKLNLMGKYLVCLPFEPGVHISKKIGDPISRDNIKKALEQEIDSEYGFIARTHAEEASLDEILMDAKALVEQANTLLNQGQYLTKGSILYQEPAPIEQMILEQVVKNSELEIVCNDETLLSTLQSKIEAYGGQHEVTYTYFNEKQNLFSIYSLTKKIDQITKRKVWLKSGGNLIIDYTEAMTIIDVNSAKAILTKNAEKATLALNKEATKEAIMQILRRNLSGMILVDLVEMKSAASKLEIYEYAKQILDWYGERSTKVYPLTELGLLQFSRTKKYQCVSHQLMEACTGCHMPYTRHSFLWALIKLEEQLSTVQLEQEKQKVYLKLCPDFYDQMLQCEMIRTLEAYYSVEIEMEKTEEKENKIILCQFYKR